jgi:integration host factor subunit beta
MNRSQIAQQLAAKFSHLTQKDAEDALNVILEAMGNSLAGKQRIEIRGFGSFTTVRRQPRIGRNPRTGDSVSVPERTVPHFEPSKLLREAVDT